MNKLVLKGLISCVFMSQVLAIATEDAEAILNGLLGDYADVKPVCTTPVKTKVVSGDIVSPTFKRTILSLRQLQNALEKTKEDAQNLSKEVENQKTAMDMLKSQVTSLTEDSQQKQEKIELLQANIGKMEDIQKLLLERYAKLAKSSGSLEAATILKMKITKEIQNIKTGLLSPEAKNKYIEFEYLSYRYTVESIALRLVVSLDTEEKRATITGLTDLYNTVFETLNLTKGDKSSFELSNESKSNLLSIFNSILKKEFDGFNIKSIPITDEGHDHMKLDLNNLTE